VRSRRVAPRFAATWTASSPRVSASRAWTQGAPSLKYLVAEVRSTAMAEELMPIVTAAVKRRSPLLIVVLVLAATAVLGILSDLIVALGSDGY